MFQDWHRTYFYKLLYLWSSLFYLATSPLVTVQIPGSQCLRSISPMWRSEFRGSNGPGKEPCPLQFSSHTHNPPPPSLTHSSHWCSCHFWNFMFLRMLLKWNYKTCILLRVALSFVQCNALESCLNCINSLLIFIVEWYCWGHACSAVCWSFTHWGAFWLFLVWSCHHKVVRNNCVEVFKWG